MMRRAARQITRLSGALLAALPLLACLCAAPAAANTDALRSQIEDFVRERADHSVSSISVPPLGDFRIAGADPDSLRVDLSSRASGRMASTVPVTVVISDGERVLKRGVVTVQLRMERPVVVATRAIRKGEPIDPGAIRLERREAATLHGSAVGDPQRVVGMEASRSIRAGAVMRAEWVERPALVERGERVRLVLHGPSLRIDAVGLALSRGAAGDTVRAVNADSRREVIGRVAPDGSIHVAF